MKRIVMLAAVILLCVGAAAKEKSVSYFVKFNGIKLKYMQCQGDFDKGVLQEGLVTFYFKSQSDEVQWSLTGNYNPSQNPNFEGVAKICDEWRNISIKSIKCVGNIYNEKRGKIILTKSKTWYIDLNFELLDFESDIIDRAMIKDSFSYENGMPIINSYDNIWKQLGNRLNVLEFRSVGGHGILLEMIVLFKNGNKYCGPAYLDSNKLKLGGRNSDNYYDCEYWWTNGDYFKGTSGIKKDDGYILPSYGTMKYADGTIDSSWSMERELIKHFTIDTTPTELREIAKEIQAQKEREKQEKEAAELREKLEKEAAMEARKQQQEQQRRQDLIDRFGQRYGTALANGQIEIGMTVEMVEAAKGHGRKNRYMSNGKEIVTLTYVNGDYNIFLNMYTTVRTSVYTFVNGRLTEYSVDE